MPDSYWKDRLRELEAERDDLELQVSALRDQVANRERASQVSESAKRLGFRRPQIAHRLIDSDVTGKARIERELKRLAKEMPELVAGPDPAEGTESPAASDHNRLIASLMGANGHQAEEQT